MSPLTSARLQVVAAAALWSLSGAFTKCLTTPTVLGVDQPPIDGLSIAFFRVFFAGLCLLPTLRLADVRFLAGMVPMALTFGAMNGLFIGAMKLGTAANAILLQYSAPLWLTLIHPLLGEGKLGRRDIVAVLVGTAGVAVILLGNWHSERPLVLAMAVGSGVTYAGVLVGLRALRDESPAWLTVVNHLGGALVLVPLVWSLPWPSPGQLAWLAVFGGAQMALPYWLMARALKVIPAHEAGVLTLLEPALNPLWAYLVSPATETPGGPTLFGGGLILAALAVRYAKSARG